MRQRKQSLWALATLLAAPVLLFVFANAWLARAWDGDVRPGDQLAEYKRVFRRAFAYPDPPPALLLEVARAARRAEQLADAEYYLNRAAREGHTRRRSPSSDSS